jgi:methyl-accepting chemotaxis protein
MTIEIIIGVIVLLIFGIWAALYIKNRTKENNNTHLFDFIPHLFPTLGILFTFIGIAVGLFHFDASTSESIERSIPELMNGLKTAFLVSIFGVALLVLFSFWTNIKRKRLEEGVLSEETIAIQKLTEVLTELKKDFYSTDENGNAIKPGNVLRDIYDETKKQSNSLQTFSTDLALTISAGFEQILNNPTEGVVAELKLVKVEIENLGNKLKDPATDMTQNIVKELQESMGKMIEEFKTSMSGDTKNEMERLAVLLGQAGGSLTDFPYKLQLMTDNLNENFLGLQEVVQQISKQTLSQSEESTNQMKKQVEDMSQILREQVGGLQNGQQNLLTEQSKNLQVSENLLSAFNTSIEKMNGLSSGVTETIGKFNHAQNDLERVIGTFRNISQDVNASASKFSESQLTFSKYSNEFLQNNSSTIQEIQKSLSTAKDVSISYAQKFEIIEKGLQQIFAQIKDGLEQYKNAVSNNLEIILGEYTKSLTKSAESLASATELQSESIKDLAEEINRLKE